MIDMQYVDGFVMENLAIDGGGMAAVGVNVDRFGPGGTVNTTDGIFRRLNVNANFIGAGNPKWVGIQFSMKQLNNVEDMRITDSVFYCGTTPTSGTAAIIIGPSYNPKNFKIEHNFIHLCNRAIWQQGGSALIASNEIGSSHIDIQLDFWTDPNERIIDNLSESAESGDRFLLINGSMNHTRRNFREQHPCERYLLDYIQRRRDSIRVSGTRSTTRRGRVERPQNLRSWRAWSSAVQRAGLAAQSDFRRTLLILKACRLRTAQFPQLN